MSSTGAGDVGLILGVAGIAALCSIGGGFLALRLRPTTLLLSVVLGLAGGVLMGAIAFDMLPRALEYSSVSVTVAGVTVGVLAIYAFEMALQRGRTAGIHAAQRRQIAHYHRKRHPAGDSITVLAGGTAVEELIEGLSIGVGATIEPRLALVVGAAIALDNVSEALSIGALVAERDGGGKRPRSPAARRRVLGWTGAIALALFVSAVVAWTSVQSVPDGLLGFLIAVGAGGMFYLTVTELVPEAELRHYQHSSALAATAGFVSMIALSAG